MRNILRAFCAVVASSAFALSAAADTQVIELVNLQPGYFHGAELQAPLSGITDVSIRAVGVGGRGLYGCVPPAQGGWYDLDCRICFGDGCIEFLTSNQTAYDVTELAAVAEGGWDDCEGVLVCPVTLSVMPRGIVNGDWQRDCWLAQAEIPAVSQLTITVTTNGTVAVESGSWGAIKAMYRR